jgi:methylphosphotriester-DNA--protein-cysteine methyltransferase
MHARVETGCVKHAVDHILSQPCETRLQTLVEQIGYSQKHFIDLFKRSVGLPPKQYMRILRFQQAIRRMEKNGSSCDWTELALQTGFYDQAHFINDFRNFSGFSPTEYLRLKSNTLNYVPVV